MIRLLDNLWIGGPDEVSEFTIGSVLCVASDIHVTSRYDVEYMQVGLVDGPGNPTSAYAAATLALATLLHRGWVMLCCHGGSRSMAVALMYLQAINGGGWDGLLGLLQERGDTRFPVPHAAHRAAFGRMPWLVLAELMKGK